MDGRVRNIEIKLEGVSAVSKLSEELSDTKLKADRNLRVLDLLHKNSRG